jgi:hypothetical protein
MTRSPSLDDGMALVLWFGEPCIRGPTIRIHGIGG